MYRLIALFSLFFIVVSISAVSFSKERSVDPYLTLVDRTCEFVTTPCVDGEENELVLRITMQNSSDKCIYGIDPIVTFLNSGTLISSEVTEGYVQPGNNFTAVVRVRTESCNPSDILVSFDGNIEDVDLQVQGLKENYCINESAVEMKGLPEGGFFAGDGCDGNYFNPKSAGPGLHEITYYFEGKSGCMHSEIVKVYVHEHPVFAVKHKDPAQPGQKSGEIVIEYQGHQQDVEYSIDGGKTFQSHGVFRLLGEGDYWATVKVAGSCLANPQPVNLQRVAALSVSISPSNPGCGFNISCYGGSDGTATANVSGGTPPYTFQWSNGQTGQSISGLSAGPLAVLVSDATGDVGIDNINLSEPPPLIVTHTFNHASGPTANDGSIQVNVNGGCPQYTFNWSGPGGFSANTPSVNNLTPGTYNLNVQDANGCVVNKNFNLQFNNPDNVPPVIMCPMNITVNSSGGNCFAAVNYNPPQGTDNQPNPQTTQTLGLSPGSNFPVGITANVFVVTDQGGNQEACVFTVTVVDNEAPVAQCTNATVSLDSNGNAIINGSTIDGGSSDNCGIGFAVPDPNVLDCSMLGSNTVTLDVIDVNGNTASCTATVTVQDNDNPTVTCPANLSLSNDAGQCGAVATYSTPSSADNCSVASTNLTAGLGSGSSFPIGTTTEAWEVVDVAGNVDNCSFTVTVSDNEPPTISCPGNFTVPHDSGKAGANVTYMTPTGTDNCSGVSTTMTAGLASGSFFPIGSTSNSFVATDASGNTAACSFTITVTAPQPLTTSTTSPTYNCGVNIPCTGATTGSIDLTVAGGIQPYTVNWTGPGGFTATTEDLNNVGAGTYNYVVTDVANTTTGGSFSLVESAPINSGITSQTYNCGYNIKCNGASDATVTTTPTGGCPPYTYSWSNGATTQNITNVPAGTYTVAITDANNWTHNDSYTVTEAPAMNVTWTVTDASNPTSQDGSIDITVSGGCAPYNFSWTGPNNYLNPSEDPQNLSWGYYNCVITDANNWQFPVPTIFVSCIPNGCVQFSYNTLTYMISNTNEDKKNGETKEGWSMRSGVFYNEDNPPTGDNSRTRITPINAKNDKPDFPKIGASFGGSPLSSCKACNGKCDPVGPAYITGTKYGSYAKTITIEQCPKPNNCAGTTGRLDVARLDANGPNMKTTMDQFPQKACLLKKRSGILVKDAGTPKECVIGEPVIIVKSGGENTIAGNSLGSVSKGIQKPSFYGVKHGGKDVWTFEAKDDGYDGVKHDRKWWIQNAFGGAKISKGTGKTMTHTFDIGRWNIILEYRDIATGQEMGKAEIHSIVVEATHTSNVLPRPKDIECPEGNKFEIRGKTFPGGILDVALFGRAINPTAANRARARVSLDGYPQNEYWGLANDRYDIPQVTQVKSQKPDSAYVQGYEKESVIKHDMRLHSDGQAFLENCTGDHKYLGTPANWRWENADQEPFSVARLEATYTKCDKDSLLNSLCIIAPSESVIKKLQNGGGIVMKNNVEQVLSDSLPALAWYAYVHDPTEKKPTVAVRVISYDSLGVQIDELKKNGARMDIKKCSKFSKEFSSDRLWLVPDDEDPKTSLDDDKTTVRAQVGGYVMLEYWSPKNVRVCQKKLKIMDLNMTTDNVPDSIELTKGQLVCFNRDNDDFNPAGAHNYEPDWKQAATVNGEDDLQRITLWDAALKDVLKGEVRLEIKKGLTGAGANNTRIKVWDSPTKDNLILDGATKVKKWSISDFKQEAPIHYWVEGYRPSKKMKDVELSLNWRRDKDMPHPMCEDLIAITVVDIYLDVDTNHVVKDDNRWYKCGYDSIYSWQQEGPPKLNAANGFNQRMKLLVAPAEVGKLESKNLTSVDFELTGTTQFTGVAMNFGTQNNTDFTLKIFTNDQKASMDTSINDIVRQEIFCRDYGGRTTANATLKRGDVELVKCALAIPRDQDRDLLPDWYEMKYRFDTIRAAIVVAQGGVAGNVTVFDTTDDRTKALGAVAIAGHTSGVPAVATVPAAQYDNETSTLPPDVGNVAGSINGGGPNVGLTGDGLTTFEEYRGFFYGNDANTANTHIHHRTNPHRKDLFVNCNGVVDQGNDLGMGYLLALRAPLNIYAHRINNNEWQNAGSREINFNRHAAGMNLPGWQGPQRALKVVNGNLGQRWLFGLAEPGNINTGPNGICQTTAAVNGAGAALDTQVIPVRQGQPNSTIIDPGPNGIIDPPKSSADVLNATTHRIEMGSDGVLNTVVAGYSPQGNDRVQASITSGSDNKIDPMTAKKADAKDVSNLVITGTASDPLHSTTVTSATIDETDNVVMDPAGDGIDFVGGVDAKDTQLGNGTVSPFNPATGKNDGFQTPLAGNDFFKGTINRGSDNVLNTEPKGNDFITGTIVPGTDNNLQSRPHGNDVAVGFIDGGPATDADGGKLNPLLNNGTANIGGAATPIAPAGPPANDDMWSPANNNIHSGADGVRHTNPQPGSDDIANPQIPDGRGLPFQLCIDGNDGDGVLEWTAATGFQDFLQTAATIDDVRERVAGINETPNEKDDIIVDVAAHNDWTIGWNGQNESVNGAGAFTGVNSNPHPLVPAALRGDDADFRIASGLHVRRRNLIRESVAHECGHGLHVEHYALAVLVANGPVRHTGGAGIPTGHGGPWNAPPVNPDNMCSNAAVISANPPVGNVVPSTYDAVSIRQMRLHLKHQ